MWLSFNGFVLFPSELSATPWFLTISFSFFFHFFFASLFHDQVCEPLFQPSRVLPLCLWTLLVLFWILDFAFTVFELTLLVLTLTCHATFELKLNR